MKTMKKMLTLVLALLMVVSLALPAMAADDDTYTITIMGSKSNDVAGSDAGHTYEAYQILSGSMEGDGLNLGVPAWGSSMKNVEDFLDEIQADDTFLHEGKNLFASVADAVGFADTIASSQFTTAMLEHLAVVFLDYIENPVVDKFDEGTDASGEVIYTAEVDPGYYLIKDAAGSLEGDDKENKDYTNIILHISQDTTVYHKGSIPTVEKTVSEANSAYYESLEVAMQREHYYKLVATLPSDIDDYESYQLTFVDTLSAGLTFIDANLEVPGLQVVSADAIHSGSETPDPLTQVYDENSEAGYTVKLENNVLTINFNNLKHNGNEHLFKTGDKIIIVYKAKLNENAIVGGSGNENQVQLQYSNDPNGTTTGTTSTDKTNVYTYGFSLTKIDGRDVNKPEDEKTPLEGVKFILYREIKDADGDSAKKYAHVNEKGAVDAWVDTVEQASELVTDADGKINVLGLDNGVKYTLEEISTVGAYKLLTGPVYIYLTAKKDDNGVVTSVLVNDDPHIANAADYKVTVGENTTVVGVQFDVPNYLGPVLPSTGGMGTTIFYILGGIMALGATLLLITKKRVSA